MLFIYIIGCSGFIKIGFAKNPEKRLASLQTGSPAELILHASFETEHPKIHEKMIHRRFRRFRVRGEWFDVPLEKAMEVTESVTQEKPRQHRKKKRGKGRYPFCLIHRATGVSP